MPRTYDSVTGGALAVAGAMMVLASGLPSAQTPAATSCDDYLLPPRHVKERSVGPSSCRKLETPLTLDGKSFTRLDIGLDGTAEGYVTKGGDYKEYLTNAPDLVFPQSSDTSPRLLAYARYERAKGAAMILVLPDRAAWNGKLWVTVHGRGSSFKEGQLKAWDRNVDPANPLADLNKYDKLMLSKGYALAKTKRTSSEGLGEIIATLEDGSTIDYAAFNDSASYIKDFTEVAENILSKRLGRAPGRTYFYGHSAGARIGRGINYTPGLNQGRDGRPMFDGILADDGAAGGWLPVVMKDGKDVLFATQAEKDGFVKQIDVTHQMYNNIWPTDGPEYMSHSYLENKRNNARILKEKGMTDRERMYEVRGISHSGGESFPDGRRGELTILDMSRLMTRFIDLLDAWVEKGQDPPPTRSDWAPLGDANGDGRIENPAIALPEVQCPLGVYYPYPNSRAGTTAFAPFTGQGLEPLDAEKVYVDMNRNGIWDYRETPTQAWQRLGLLKEGQPLTREAYVGCVDRAARQLQKDGFLSAETVTAYAQQAQTADLQPKPAAAGTK